MNVKKKHTKQKFQLFKKKEDGYRLNSFVKFHKQKQEN